MRSMGEWRKINMRNTILHIIRSEGKASKFQLQKITRYSMTTVLATIDDLVANGLIVSVGKGESNGGRRPEHFIINPDGGFFIGIEFNVLAISGALLNFRGEIVETRRVQFERGVMSPARLTQAILDMAEEMHAPIQAAGSRCFGIGVGSPGLIDFKAGVDLTYNDFSAAESIPTRVALEKRFGVPVYMDHNVNTIALAYKTLDEEHQEGDFVLFSIRKGIRVSCITNGKMVYGRNNSAGEIGHIPLPGNARLCVCGRRGCLDSLASDEGIALRLQELIQDGGFQELFDMAGRDLGRITAATFVDSVLAGHAESLAFLEDIYDRLGFALTQVINILNPPKVIIYGELTRIGEPFIAAMRKRIDSTAFLTNARNVQLVSARLNYSISAIGAAILVMNQAFPHVSIIKDLSGATTI